ncbi:guanine nucleotide binding protein, alpha subunit [Polychytrium aggregatum]|uniref:guanine nucleotide binding protein, alpha subunit n=1 Tax=Polychytrium aggregatum TaxID=110093 RepID=UPI0022FE3248|nr:guanine nucleotide binding protein, alpha subunit [Polychytrium aggregatum]KAI9199740.1 guanine nucleotide binding protein, alpha subunit [Polychytrium aggregatum]
MCTKDPELQSQLDHSRNIDKNIQAEAKKLSTDPSVKLLLLGTGESGKSTILKQFKLIHGAGFSKIELSVVRDCALGNLVTSMISLIDAMTPLNIEFEDPDRAMVRISVLTPYYSPETDMSVDQIEAIECLWSDEGIQRCFKQSNKFQLLDSCEYLMSNIRRITAKNFVPTPDDALRVRIMTTTVTESVFEIKSVRIRIFDIGGQRSERRKWMAYFDDCQAMIFMSAVGSYDQVCSEDEETNRMVESLRVFEGICNNPLFEKTAIILFLNKIDVLTSKLTSIPVSDYFPDYKGPNEVRAVCEYFGSKFLATNKAPSRKIYIHQTVATNTDQVRKVIADVVRIVAKENLAKNNLL